MSGTIPIEPLGGGVALLEIDNPPMNPLGVEMWAVFMEALDRVEAGGDVRAIVVTGRGRAFCSGDDLKNVGEGGEDLAGFGRLLERLDRSRAPAVAAVNGWCVGGGFELALSRDIRVASTGAKFVCAGVNVGLIASAHRLPRPKGFPRPRASSLGLWSRTPPAASRSGSAQDNSIHAIRSVCWNATSQGGCSCQKSADVSPGRFYARYGELEGDRMDRRGLLACGCALLADTALAAPHMPPPSFLPLKFQARISLASLRKTWDAVPFKARFTKSNGADSVVPGLAVRTPAGVEAFCAYCPHELCLIKLDDAHQLRCPCHFSLFDPLRAGAWISGPATRRTYQFEHAVRGDELVITGIEADLERRLL
jgi:nitrite reductase/ring-hydroxylating ferredoxin subunit